MAWASLKMRNFGKFKLYQAITLLCAFVFVCIKSVEYHDKFTHYEVHLNLKPDSVVKVKDEEGKESELKVGAVLHKPAEGEEFKLQANAIADGHMLVNDAEKIVLHGHFVDKVAAAKIKQAWQEREIKEEEIEIKNRADAMVYSTEKMLKENRAKIPEDDAKNIEAAIEEAKKAIQEKDSSKITAAVERLTQASHKLAEAMYKQSAPGPGAPGAGASGSTGEATASGGADGQGKGEGEVIDAEVVDADEKKKS